MTNKELIDRLSQYDPEATVYISSKQDNNGNVSGVYFDICDKPKYKFVIIF